MVEFKLIITGCSDFNNYPLFKKIVDRLLLAKSWEVEIIIISGMSNGADMLGERYAAEMGFEVQEFLIDGSLGPGAEPIRNQQMVNVADACICFWDGWSKETKSMIELVTAKGIPLRVIKC